MENYTLIDVTEKLNTVKSLKENCITMKVSKDAIKYAEKILIQTILENTIYYKNAKVKINKKDEIYVVMPNNTKYLVELSFCRDYISFYDFKSYEGIKVFDIREFIENLKTC